jgi:hypothetical protein
MIAAAGRAVAKAAVLVCMFMKVPLLPRAPGGIAEPRRGVAPSSRCARRQMKPQQPHRAVQYWMHGGKALTQVNAGDDRRLY